MAFNSNKTTTLGKCMVKCLYKQKFYFIESFIVDFECNTIIRLTICKNLKLIFWINIVKSDKETNRLNEYTDLLEGLGCFTIT